MHKVSIIWLLCHFGLFIRTCVSQNAIVSNDTIFCLFYAEAGIYTKNLLSSDSIVWSFQWTTQGRRQSKIEKMWHKLMEWKMRLCKWYTFWIAPWLIFCFTRAVGSFFMVGESGDWVKMSATIFGRRRKKNWLKHTKAASPKKEIWTKYKWFKISYFEFCFWKYYFGHETFLYQSRRSSGHYQSFF